MWEDFLQPTPKAAPKQKSPLIAGGGGGGFDIPDITLEAESEVEESESTGVSMEEAEDFKQAVANAKKGGSCSCW